MIFDSDSDSDSDPLPLLPDEPTDFRPAPAPATTTTYKLTTAPHETLALRLVGHNPLWGHMLWNAGRIVSAYLETHQERLILNQTVLELGAGAGLPALTCALRGASNVIVTDYPDAPLIDNLRHNIALLPCEDARARITAQGYLWGNPLPEGVDKKFGLVVLSDLLFNHSEHAKLVRTLVETLDVTGTALVFFTPHRPWLLEKDLAFLKLVEEEGLVVKKVTEVLLERPMFEEDKGDRDLRRTVFGYELTWRVECESV